MRRGFRTSETDQVPESPHEGLDFQLLGALEVRQNGRPVRLTAAKHRVLLAGLLLRDEQVVPFDELAEMIWSDAQPKNPRRAIQLYITRIRKELDLPGFEEIITTCPEGYRINARPEQIDLGRFRLGLKLADQAAEAGYLAGELAALTQALSEWRGEPLAGLPSDVLQREVVPQLREQRIRSLERRFDVKLSLGRGEEVINELYMLTARHPLREHLWVQLMTALEGSSRQADAIMAYHTVRKHLAGELGIDPGTSLQVRYAEILASRPPHADLGSSMSDV
jgi:DNA-binding SARP family transcriptional activator